MFSEQINIHSVLQEIPPCAMLECSMQYAVEPNWEN